MSPPGRLGHALLALALLAGTLATASSAGAGVLDLSAPTVTTGVAQAITYRTAVLTAAVNPGGLPTSYHFEYGPTAAMGTQTPPVDVAAGTAAVKASDAVTGLLARTGYHFRLVAVNVLGTTSGADAEFTTAAAPAAAKPKPASKPKPVPKPKPPVVRTGAANAVTFESATLRGTINPSGQPATYFFQYGPTAQYGRESPAAPLAAGTRAVVVTGAIPGLVPLTKYHYRLIAVNAAGTALGADATFATRAIPLSLAIAALPSPVAFGAPVSLVGALSGTGASGRTVVLQQNPYPFTGGFQNVGNPELAAPTGAFRFNLLSLPVTTQFRVLGAGTAAAVVSPTLTDYVTLGVTMHTTSHRTRTGSFSLHFSGRIAPAEVGARVSLQRLAAGRWERVTSTSARASSGGSSSYSATLRRRHGGFFRIHVTPVEGGHVAGLGPARLVHARAG